MSETKVELPEGYRWGRKGDYFTLDTLIILRSGSQGDFSRYQFLLNSELGKDYPLPNGSGYAVPIETAPPAQVEPFPANIASDSFNAGLLHAANRLQQASRESVERIRQMADDGEPFGQWCMEQERVNVCGSFAASFMREIEARAQEGALTLAAILERLDAILQRDRPGHKSVHAQWIVDEVYDLTEELCAQIEKGNR